MISAQNFKIFFIKFFTATVTRPAVNSEVKPSLPVFQGSLVPSHPFPTVDVPDHAHYTIGVVILVVGITGMLGNFLVMYAFSR